MTISKRKTKIFVIMPAYNAEKTLMKTYNEIPKALVHRIILVDDGSQDNTVAIAKKLGLKTFVHPKNLGYGANQKTCYSLALRGGADIVVMLHPDYQYDARFIKRMIDPIIEEKYDIVLGSRIQTKKEALQQGMPLYKYYGNRFLSMLENIVLGQNLPEWHTGFRSFKTEVLKTVPFQRFSNDFIFDQQILASAIALGFQIGSIHVPYRYFPDASSINFRKSVIYGLGIIYILLLSILHRLGLKSSIFQKETK